MPASHDRIPEPMQDAPVAVFVLGANDAPRG
jgi:hypothetical protein